MAKKEMIPTAPTVPTTTGAMNSDGRFELLVQSIHEYAIFLLDAQGFINSWNTGAERLKGYTAEEVFGQHFSIFYTEADRAAGLPGHVLELAAKHGEHEMEGWRVRKDGSKFWANVVINSIVDDTGTLIGFAKITRDVSDKKASEKALFESEQRFRILVQGVRDYAIFMLDPKGYITNWNSGAALIKGYSAEEAIGRHFSCFYTAEDQRKGEPERGLAAARKYHTYQNEGWRVRKDGSVFWASVVIDAIYDEQGTLAGFAKITRDITERKRAQDEIENQREALSRSQKLEALGRVTGGVAHDFNNLLTIIQSSVELLQNPDLDPEKRARYIEAISSTASRAAILTGQLLAFARQQPLRPEGFAVGPRVEALRQVLETTLGGAIALNLDIPPYLRIVEADVNQFESALLNLAINARDAMPQGGALRIGAHNVNWLPPIRRHAGALGKFAAITVSDTGTGIDPCVIDRIFEPFFTTKATGKGTGLGLSQVYGFAKQSGGDIDVTATPGQGTTFTLYLPQAISDNSSPDPDAAKVPEQPIPHMAVLLVEDNLQVGKFAHDMLSDLGHEVTWVTDGAAALQALHAHSGRYDLVLSDVVMVGISGIELGKKIRQLWPDLRVVLTSGYSQVLAHGKDHGFEFLQKPYTPDKLLALISDN